MEKNIFYSLSSHGYSGLASKNESDGRDEYIRTPNIIRDDEFRSIFNKLNPKTKIYALIDTCSSGTMFDLRYVKDPKLGKREENKLDCIP